MHIFDGNAARIIERDGNTKIGVTRVNGLYYLQEDKHECKITTAIRTDRGSVETPMEIWHRRMGHLNLRDLSTSVRDGNVRGVKFTGPERDFKCEVCALGKMTRAPFPKKSER